MQPTIMGFMPPTFPFLSSDIDYRFPDRRSDLLHSLELTDIPFCLSYYDSGEGCVIFDCGLVIDVPILRHMSDHLAPEGNNLQQLCDAHLRHHKSCYISSRWTFIMKQTDDNRLLDVGCKHYREEN